MNELRDLLLGGNPWIYLLECVLRTTVMFVVVLFLFKLTGKKEVRQFSILELLVIIGLGSALGDPMLHPDAPLLPALVAIAMVLLLYRLVNHWTNRSPRVGRWVEGEVMTVMKDGMVDAKALDHEGLSLDEFFGDLRVQHVEHLGQVKSAHMEVDGQLSIFFHDDGRVGYGLPIAPEALAKPLHSTELPQGPASCTRCGFTAREGAPPLACPRCAHDRWLPAERFPRVG